MKEKYEEGTVPEVDIESFERFKEKNQDMIRCFDEASSYLTTILKNIAGVDVTVANINSSFGGLKKVEKIQIDNCQNLKNAADSLVKEFNFKISELTGALLYYEEQILMYNQDPNKILSFNDILKFSSNLGLFWIGKEACKSMPFLSGLTFIMAYGTDAAYDNGNYIVGDSISAVLLSKLTPIAQANSFGHFVLSTGVGAGFVFMWTAATDMANDLGDFTIKDTERLLLDASIQSLSFFSWTLICAKVGAATSGPVGALVATVVVAPITAVLGGIKDYIVGDNEIDSFVRIDENGNEIKYSVKANGTGNNGTFDAFIDILESSNSNEEYSIGNYIYSEEEYKQALYRDFRTVLDLDLGSSSQGAFSDEERDELYKLLIESAKEDTAEKAEAYLYEKLLSNGGLQSTFYSLFLCKEYHFDYYEFYNYTNNIE